jgi:hypothetical protein|tara:strand:- start:239 stop:505 length:267 start_codon:yes stop_codon:yes gene_type:complete
MNEQELELYFRQMNDLFRQEGWQNLIEEMKLNLPNINSIENAKDEKDLYFRKGQLNMIGFLLNLEETTRIGQEESLKEQTFEDDYVDV